MQANTVISGYQLMVQQIAEQRPSLQGLLKNFVSPLKEQLTDAPTSRSLIEISGASNSGKTWLLSQILLQCLLLHSVDGGNGVQCQVVLFNLSHKLKPAHFEKQLRAKIKALQCFKDEKEEAEIFNKCKESLIFINCFSTDDFDLAFDVVENVLLDNEQIAMLAIDTLGAFYWEDTSRIRVRMNTHYARALARLRKLCNSHNICCVFTVNENYASGRGLSAASFSAVGAAAAADYALKIKLSEQGERSINGHAFSIDDKGFLEWLNI